MENDRLILNRIKYYLEKEIYNLKKKEDNYKEEKNHIKASCKQEAREELECLQAIIKSWEA